MLKNILTASLASALLLSASDDIGITQKIDTTQIIKQGKHRPGTVLYKLKKNVEEKKLAKLEKLMKKYQKLEKKKLKKSNTEKVTFRMKGIEKKIAKLMKETGAVEYAEVDALVEHAFTTANDPYYLSQWHHPNTGVPHAWDTTKGKGVRVCVIDTGVDTDHPDLAANLELPGYNSYLDVSGNVEDLYGHGTGTAGTIAAIADNGRGVAGIAPEVRILPVQISQGSLTSSAYISDMAEGIRWCADQGVQVANLSYGGAESRTISDAAQYLKDRGGLLFMAAGNDGQQRGTGAFPDYESFMTIGATNSADRKSDFSDYGHYVDLTAPGEGIATTYLNGRYVYYDGTSFSTPVVAAIAALGYSVNPNITPDEVESYLKSTATDLGSKGEDILYGAGKVDAAAFIAKVLDNGTSNKLPVAIASADIKQGSSPLNVNFTGDSSYDSDGDIKKYSWDFGNGDSSEEINPSYTYNNAGTFVATLTVTDNEGATDASDAIKIKVTNSSSNQLPEPVILTNANGGYAPLTITFDGSTSVDSDGDIVSYQWDFGNGDTASSATTDYTYTTPGKYNVTLTVTDNDNAEVTSKAKVITVLEDNGNVSIPVPKKFKKIKFVDDNVLFTWKSSKNATSYDIYKSTNSSQYQLVSSTSELYFIETDLDKGDYKYFVKASNGSNQSKASTIRSLKVTK